MRASTCWSNRRPRRVAPACALLLVTASLAAPGHARAAVSVTGFGVQPSDTQAAGHPSVAISTSFAIDPPSDALKSLTVVLPQGLTGNPTAADACTQSDFAADACPAGSKVGTSQTAVTVATGAGDVPQTAPGDVYNLRPTGAEPARLGLVVRPSAVGPVGLPKLFLQSPVTIGPQTNYGLSTTFDNIPRSAGPFAIRVGAITLDLAQSAAHGPFLTNPTSCAAGVATATATSYDAPGTSTRTGPFTASGCGALAFAPVLGASVAGPGQTAEGAHPALASAIAFEAGQANVRRLEVVLPRSLSTSVGQVDRACDRDLLATGGCPPGATVGSAVVASPLLPAELSAPVVLTRSPTSGLPALSVRFGGSVPLQLDGQTGFAGSLLTTTFDGLPDLPVSRFSLAIAGGPDGLLTNTADLCSKTAKTELKVELAAHSGRNTTLRTPLAVLGCPGGGSARSHASLAFRVVRGRGTLSARLSPPRSAPGLRRATVTLPRGLRANLGHLRVTAGGDALARGRLRLRGRTLDIRPAGTGAGPLRLRWTHIRVSAAVRRSPRRRARLRFTVRLTDLLDRTTVAGITPR